MAGVTLVVGTATVLGELAGGIGFSGLFTTGLAGLLVAALMLRYPRLSIPRQVDLGHGPLATVVARAELWLERISQGWPPAAVQEVDRLGIQLDALAMELERATLGGKTEHAIRTLVAERLPAAVLRPGPPGAPAETPRLVTALARIGAELSHVTRSLAGGDADGIALVTALAVR